MSCSDLHKFNSFDRYLISNSFQVFPSLSTYLTIFSFYLIFKIPLCCGFLGFDNLLLDIVRLPFMSLILLSTWWVGGGPWDFSDSISLNTAFSNMDFDFARLGSWDSLVNFIFVQGHSDKATLWIIELLTSQLKISLKCQVIQDSITPEIK